MPKGEESVEHLVAEANGGSNDDENCVACCKTLNRLLGRMSLKEKLNVILNQKGDFSCPGRIPKVAEVAHLPSLAPVVPVQAMSSTETVPLPLDEQVAIVVMDLHKRGNAKPGKEDRLLNTIRSALVHKEAPPAGAEKVLEAMKNRGLISVEDGKICAYYLPAR